MFSKTTKRIWSVFSTLMTLILLVLTFLLVGVRLIGLTPYAIVNESMEPDLPSGSIVYVKEVPIDEIEIGSSITYVLNEDLAVVTSRVVKFDKEAQLFTTKSDASNTVDAKLVHFNNVLGMVKYSLPYLGNIAVFIKTTKGIIVLVTITGILAIGGLLKILLENREK